MFQLFFDTQEEIQREAQRSDHDVTPIMMALSAGFEHTRAMQALQSMLSRNTLNPADIVVSLEIDGRFLKHCHLNFAGY
jgi:hypothetical protein